jgi:hypothetical protein
LQIADCRLLIDWGFQFPMNLQSAFCILQFHDSLRLFMRCMFAAEAAELAELEPLGRLLFVLRRAVVAPLALGAGERDDVSHVGTRQASDAGLPASAASGT